MSEIETSNSLENNNGINIITSLSKGCQSFFKKFLWRIIYSIKFKEFQFMSEEELTNQLILEVQKPKVIESFIKSKKKFAENKAERDIYVYIFYYLLCYF